MPRGKMEHYSQQQQRSQKGPSSKLKDWPLVQDWVVCVSLVPSPSHPSYGCEIKAGVGRTGNEVSVCSRPSSAPWAKYLLVLQVCLGARNGTKVMTNYGTMRTIT